MAKPLNYERRELFLLKNSLTNNNDKLIKLFYHINNLPKVGT